MVPEFAGADHDQRGFRDGLHLLDVDVDYGALTMPELNVDLVLERCPRCEIREERVEIYNGVPAVKLSLTRGLAGVRRYVLVAQVRQARFDLLEFERTWLREQLSGAVGPCPSCNDTLRRPTSFAP